MNYTESKFVNKSDLGLAQSSNIGGTGINAVSQVYDPKQSQFHGSEAEVRALFDSFQRNNKVDLKEFLDILASTGTFSPTF